MGKGILYVVATPLGNLEDVSARAVRLLAEAEVIYAEDTRRSRVLLDHYGISRPLRSLHEHNERQRSSEVLALLATGGAAALLTDAGTPAVSDPGAELVRQVVAAGLSVSPIPGPSALTAALSVAGFTGDVLFLGFVPSRGKERRAGLAKAIDHSGTVVLFEAPHRLFATLAELAATQPERPACVCRELTKVYEEIRRGSLRELAEWASGEVKGELTLVLGPVVAQRAAPQDAAIDAALERCKEAGLSTRDAVAAVAAVLELPRRQVYSRVSGS